MAWRLISRCGAQTGNYKLALIIYKLITRFQAYKNFLK